jgi:hypothetical protein
LGGEWTLPSGVVCDTCNNYFARKVEDPFLSNGRVRHLRQRQEIPNKRGSLPACDGIVLAHRPIQVEFVRFQEELQVRSKHSAENAELEEYLSSIRTGKLVLAPGPFLDDRIIQRFVSKVAIECLALRTIEASQCLQENCCRDELAELRRFARYGDNLINWPVCINRIYHENSVFCDGRDYYQILSEFEFIYTPEKILYFCIVMFGVEFCINMCGPVSFDRLELKRATS